MIGRKADPKPPLAGETFPEWGVVSPGLLRSSTAQADGRVTLTGPNWSKGAHHENKLLILGVCITLFAGSFAYATLTESVQAASLSRHTQIEAVLAE